MCVMMRLKPRGTKRPGSHVPAVAGNGCSLLRETTFRSTGNARHPQKERSSRASEDPPTQWLNNVYSKKGERKATTYRGRRKG